MKTVSIGRVAIGGDGPLALIAGPCVIESRSHCHDLAAQLQECALHHRISFIFKASYDKANRTSIHSYRGPGLAERTSSMIARYCSLSTFRRLRLTEKPGRLIST